MPPFVPPSVGAYDAPTVCLKLNEYWISYVLGVVAFLDRDSVWEGDEATVYEARQQIQKIFNALMVGNAVETPIASVLAYAGESVPDHYLWCDGTVYLIADYPDLAAALYGAFINDETHFRVPDLRDRFPKGWTPAGTDDTGDTGGAASHVLTVAEMPIHTHIQDSHNHTQNSHNHTQDSHNHTQDSHNHTQNSHLHDIAHTHTIFGRTSATGFGTTNRAAMADSGGANSTPSTQSQSTTNSGNATATNIATTATNQAATATNQAATATNQATTATNQNTGGGEAHPNIPPYMAVRYIIRAE